MMILRNLSSGAQHGEVIMNHGGTESTENKPSEATIPELIFALSVRRVQRCVLRGSAAFVPSVSLW
jgi:hypothetical protein